MSWCLTTINNSYIYIHKYVLKYSIYIYTLYIYIHCKQYINIYDHISTFLCQHDPLKPSSTKVRLALWCRANWVYEGVTNSWSSLSEGCKIKPRSRRSRMVCPSPKNSMNMYEHPSTLKLKKTYSKFIYETRSSTYDHLKHRPSVFLLNLTRKSPQKLPRPIAISTSNDRSVTWKKSSICSAKLGLAWVVFAKELGSQRTANELAIFVLSLYHETHIYIIIYIIYKWYKHVHVQTSRKIIVYHSISTQKFFRGRRILDINTSHELLRHVALLSPAQQCRTVVADDFQRTPWRRSQRVPTRLDSQPGSINGQQNLDESCLMRQDLACVSIGIFSRYFSMFQTAAPGPTSLWPPEGRTRSSLLPPKDCDRLFFGTLWAKTLHGGVKAGPVGPIDFASDRNKNENHKHQKSWDGNVTRTSQQLLGHQ